MHADTKCRNNISQLKVREKLKLSDWVIQAQWDKNKRNVYLYYDMFCAARGYHFEK